MRYKKFLVVTILLFLFMGVLCSTILGSHGSPLLAVISFESSSAALQQFRWSSREREEFLESLSQQLTNVLVEREGIRVVERARIRDVLTEQDFALTGRVDTSSAAAIGRILGVGYLILGSLDRLEVVEKGRIGIGPLSATIVEATTVMRARIVCSETAEIVTSAEGMGIEQKIGVSVSSIYGLSFGTTAFSQSAVAESIESAIKNMVNELETKYSSLLVRPETAAVRGNILVVMGNRLIIDVGSQQSIKEGDEGRLIRLMAVEGLVDPVTIPYGQVRVFSVDPQAAVVEITQADETPQVGDVVEFR